MPSRMESFLRFCFLCVVIISFIVAGTKGARDLDTQLHLSLPDDLGFESNHTVSTDPFIHEDEIGESAAEGEEAGLAGPPPVPDSPRHQPPEAPQHKRPKPHTDDGSEGAEGAESPTTDDQEEDGSEGEALDSIPEQLPLLESGSESETATGNDGESEDLGDVIHGVEPVGEAGDEAAEADGEEQEEEARSPPRQEQQKDRHDNDDDDKKSKDNDFWPFSLPQVPSLPSLPFPAPSSSSSSSKKNSSSNRDEASEHNAVAHKSNVPRMYNKVCGRRECRRLPEGVRPSAYKLELLVELDRFKYNGTVAISIQLLNSSTSSIWLHCHDSIDITSVELYHHGSTYYHTKPVSWTMWPDLEMVEVRFDPPIRHTPSIKDAADNTLTLEFEGDISTRLDGFYRSSYKDEDGTEHFMASTQFEATDARRAFPCFDEPALKAQYSIAITAAEDLMALSNMPETSATPYEYRPGFVTHTFDTSVPMSTYLVAWAVGHFADVSATVDDINVRVLTRAGKGHQGKYALKCGVDILHEFARYFDIKYPLAKLDMLGVPDFASGAMENWGLVTYRETALVIDEGDSDLADGSDNTNSQAAATTAGTSSFADRQRVCSVVAHELAHQWFGNLVTMVWWSDIWLNEGFATFMEHMGVNLLHPEWRIWDDFQLDMAAALAADAFDNSHALASNVTDPSQISEMFDGVSYVKGSSIVRMLSHYLSNTVGKSAFRDGVKRYLKRHAYKNAETIDLWRSLAQSSGRNIPEDMHSWTHVKGFPLITFVATERDRPLYRSGSSSDRYGSRSQKTKRNATNSFYIAHQRPFKTSGPQRASSSSRRSDSNNNNNNNNNNTTTNNNNNDDNEEEEAAEALWWVPLIVRTAEGDEIYVENFNEEKSSKFEIDTDSWFKANYGQYGYYRVNYPDSNWAALADAAQTDALSIIDRAGLIDDALALTKASYVLPHVALDFLRIADPVSHVVLANQQRVLGWMMGVLQEHADASVSRALSAHARALVAPLMQALDFDFQRPRSTHAMEHYKRVLAQAVLYDEPASVDAVMNFMRNFTSPASAPEEEEDASSGSGSSSSSSPAVTMPVDLRAVFYSAYVAHGGPEAYEWVMERYLNITLGVSERRDLLFSLCASRDLRTTQKTLDFALSNHVRAQDAPRLIVSCSNSFNVTVRKLVWAFVKDNWSKLNARYGSGKFLFRSLIGATTHGFATQEAYQDVDSFFRAHPAPSARLTVAQSLESIRNNVRWLAGDGPADVASWLKR